MSRPYTHIQAVEKEMLEMKAAGKTNREIAEHFGFKDKYVVGESIGSRDSSFTAMKICWAMTSPPSGPIKSG